MSQRRTIGRNLSSKQGFTLIELLISMTLLCLVMVVLYQTFATATRVWSKQELFDEGKARQMAVDRLLESDLHQLVPYKYLHAKGEFSFFAGTSRVLFYVTRNGYAAHNRDRYGLFFVCCYLQEEDDGSLSLRVYKSSLPEAELMQAYEGFLQAGSQDQHFWTLPDQLAEKSTKVLGGLSQAGFFYEQENRTFDYFNANGIINEQDVTQSWLVTRKLPEVIRFSYQLPEGSVHIFVRPFSAPDPLDKDQVATAAAAK